VRGETQRVLDLFEHVNGAATLGAVFLHPPGFTLALRSNAADLSAKVARPLCESLSGAAADWRVSVHVKSPRAPWPKAPLPMSADRGGVIAGLPEGFLGAFNAGTGTLTILDLERERAVILTEEEWHQSDLATPFAALFSLAFPGRGRVLLHGAALAGVRGALLIPGFGEAGKSTTSVLASAAGYGFMGDDYCALSTKGVPTVECVYRTARLEVDARLTVPGFTAEFADPRSREPKHLFFMGEKKGIEVVACAPLAALLIPSRAGGRASRLEPLSARDAARLASASTIFGLPGAPDAVLSALSAAASKVPCFRLFLGTEPASILDCLETLSPSC